MQPDGAWPHPGTCGTPLYILYREKPIQLTSIGECRQHGGLLVALLALLLLLEHFGLLLLQGWAWYQSVPLLAKHASGVIWVVQSVVVVLLNYILGKFLVFRRKKQQKQEQ